MPSVSGRSSPLPSFSAPPHVSSTSLFAALSALTTPPSSSSTTILEKSDALSNRARSRSVSGHEWWITRRFWDVFAPLVLVGRLSSSGSGSGGVNHHGSTLTVPGTNGLNVIGNGSSMNGRESNLRSSSGSTGTTSNLLGISRSLTIPVLRILHPARESGRTLHRRDGRTNHAYGGTVYSTKRVVIALVGTGLSFLLVFLFFFALFRPLLPSRRSLPFVGEPNTCILTTEEIQRVWLWEIAAGRYPSSRKPGIDLRGGGKQRKGVRAMGLGKVENPSVPKKSELDERKMRMKEAERVRSYLAQKSLTSKTKDAANRRGGESTATVETVEITPPEVDISPVGPPRSYLPIIPPTVYHPSTHSSALPPSPFPPRPKINSVLDLDVVMDHCDFSEGKYVRDCLEVLRMNAGMDHPGLRRGDANGSWKMSFTQGELPATAATSSLVSGNGAGSDKEREERRRRELKRMEGDIGGLLNSSTTFAGLLATKQQLTLFPPPPVGPNEDVDVEEGREESAPIKKHRFIPHPSHPTADPGCDPDYPRIFHIFWAGPFTDKPYSAAMSFLYTQRLSLEKPIGSAAALTSVSSTGEVELICRPQLWIWINPGPASSRPDPLARVKMMKELAANPWSKPLLHPRFTENIKFKLWNTTEQLDSVQEMKGWKELRLFNSGGVKYGSAGSEKSSESVQEPSTTATEPPAAESTLSAEIPVGRFGDDSAEKALLDDASTITSTSGSDPSPTAVIVDAALDATKVSPPLPVKTKDELFERIGSTSSKGYDRLSVVLSDMARFVLTHRFGGVYLDADTILLRDWEELWGWHGAFAYRWSRLAVYNTAVLKMSRGSAIGNAIFRMAVANGLDFHPMTISRYTSDAKMEGLLLRLPDAMFDPAWLNTEYYQRDRPPFPYFKRFEDFFETPKDSSAAPISLGFDGFFKGSFSYHFHNFWWIPFDPARNFPDLGPRFIEGERIARGRLHAAKLASMPRALRPPSHLTPGSPHPPAKALEAARLAAAAATIPAGSLTADGLLENDGRPAWGDDERDFDQLDWSAETVDDDERDLSWAAVLKRTFEAFVRGERPNLYGDWIDFEREE